MAEGRTRAGETLVRPYRPERDRAWASSILERHLAGRVQARRGELIDALSLSGLVAVRGRRRVGLLTYRPDGQDVELFVIVALVRRRGVGGALLDALVRAAGGARLIWLVTTNDNLPALGFFQGHGFRLRALRPGAIDAARRDLKPTIPITGAGGIALRDELELELLLR